MCVCCVLNYSFELILCSEHTINRSTHLFQNKSRRHAAHHFELIRLTWANFKSIGLHSFTESLRVQLKNTNVKVFDLAPPLTQTELLGGFDVDDMKGASLMKVEDMVTVAVKGMQTDRFEIRPGQANQLKIMSRVAPGFILKQMSRSVDRMLKRQN